MKKEQPFSQLKLRFRDPIQYEYEAIRPVILFAQPVTQRSRETKIPRTTVGKKAKQFVTSGMFGLLDQQSQVKQSKLNPYPEPVAHHILSFT